MKHTQQKDAITNIRRQFVSFLSILIVISLGVGIYLACRNGAQAMANRGDEFYNETNYRDIEVRATHGITAEDLEAAASLEGVTDVESVFAMDLVASGEDSRAMAHILSLTERLDQPVLLEGRLPQTAGECAAEPELLEKLDLSVGDTLTIESKEGEQAEYMTGSTFLITGTVRHPDNYKKGNVVLDNVMLTEEAFDKEAAGIEGTGMLIRTDASHLNTFSEEYKEQIDGYMHALADLGQERAELRDEDIRSDAQEQIDDARKEADEGREKLEEGKEEYAAGEKELSEGREQLDKATAELEDAKKQAADGEKQLADSRKELESAREKLAEAEKQLADSKSELDAGAEELNTASAELEEARGQLEEASDYPGG